jgi:hypothetical protein
MFTPSDVENLKLIYHLVKEKGMTLEGANNTMKRRGKSVKRDVSILERLQNIRAMLVEVRNSLGEDSPAEYEAPIEAVNDLITDVEAEAKAEVMETITTAEEQKEEPAAEETPRRRGRPRKVVAEESADSAEKSEKPVVRRRAKKKNDENKELFPFYEQSLF